MSIIKGLAALMAPKWDPAALPKPLDLTRPGSGATPEERAALIGLVLPIGLQCIMQSRSTVLTDCGHIWRIQMSTGE